MHERQKSIDRENRASSSSRAIKRHRLEPSKRRITYSSNETPSAQCIPPKEKKKPERRSNPSEPNFANDPNLISGTWLDRALNQDTVWLGPGPPARQGYCPSAWCIFDFRRVPRETRAAAAAAEGSLSRARDVFTICFGGDGEKALSLSPLRPRGVALSAVSVRSRGGDGETATPTRRGGEGVRSQG